MSTTQTVSPVDHKATVDNHLTMPKVSGVWLTIFNTVLLPILPSLVTLALQKANDKVKTVLRETRDVLVAADLGDGQ